MKESDIKLWGLNSSQSLKTTRKSKSLLMWLHKIKILMEVDINWMFYVDMIPFYVSNKMSEQ